MMTSVRTIFQRDRATLYRARCHLTTRVVRFGVACDRAVGCHWAWIHVVGRAWRAWGCRFVFHDDDDDDDDDDDGARAVRACVRARARIYTHTKTHVRVTRG